MANIKITDLTAYTDAASTDVLPIVDVGADVTKKITIGNVVKAVPLGTAALPGLAFDGDPNSGIYSPGADQVAISTNGTGRLFISDDGKVGIGVSDPSSYNISADDLVIASPGGGNTGIQINITDNSGSSNIWFGDSDGEGRGQITYAHGTSDSMGFWVGGAQNLSLYATGALAHIGGGSTISPAVSFNGSAPSNSLVIDSSGRVGLGTSSPSERLTVSGNGNFSGAFIGTRDTGSNLIYNVFGNTPGSSYSVPRGIEFNVGSGAGVTTAAVISSSGNVGIGTQTPSYELDIRNGNGATLSIGRNNNAGTNSEPGYIRFRGPNASGTEKNWAEILPIVADATNGSEDASLVFRTIKGGSTTDSIRIDSVGRLLVGTSSAFGSGLGQVATSNSHAIDIGGFNTFAANAGRLTFYRSKNGTIGSGTVLAANDSVGRIDFRGYDSNTYELAAQIQCEVDGTPGDGDMPGRLVFSTTADSASSPTERMRIDSSGNVGINVTSPSYPLVVRESSNVCIELLKSNDASILTIGEDGSGSAVFNAPNGSCIFQEGGSEAARIDTSGRLLVGTSSSRSIGESIISPRFQIETPNSSIAGLSLIANRGDTIGPSIYLGKSRAAANGGTTVVASGDALGVIRFAGADGTDLETQAALIGCYVDGTPGANDMPGRLVFSTTADGASSPTARATIDSSGRLLVGTTSSTNVAGREALTQIRASGTQASLSIARTDATGGGGGIQLAADYAVSSGVQLGTIKYAGNDGTDVQSIGASIDCFVDGTPGSDDMPGRLVFSTTADGASSPTARATIDSSGRLLVGTSTSKNVGTSTAADLQIERTAVGSTVITAVNHNNGPTGAAISLGKSRGTAAGSNTIVQNGDDLGEIRFAGADGTDIETRAAAIYCQVDGTPGANDMPGRLVFSTTADGASSPTERMRITNNGFTKASSTNSYASTTGKYHEFRSGEAGDSIALFHNTAASFTGTIPGVIIKYTASSPNDTSKYFLYCEDSTALRAGFRSNGGLANYQSNNVDLSDERAKRDISPAPSTWDCVQAWDVVNYNYLDDAADDAARVGVIAQQVQQHCPEVVIPYQEAEEAVLGDDGNVVTPAKDERLGVREQQMMWMAIKALQEAQLRIEALEAKVAALEGN
jgi:hypothetical protein